MLSRAYDVHLILFYCNFMSTRLLFILDLYVTKIILNGIFHV